MADESLLELAADIVSAHVSHNKVSVDQLPGLIEGVYGSLARLGNEPEVAEAKPEPAVSIRASVKPDALTCLECGAKLKMLKRHLSTDHGLTVEEYRARWNLKSDYPVVAPEYAARRKELAQKIGLGRKRGQKIKRKDAEAASPASTSIAADPSTALVKSPAARKRRAKTAEV